MNNRQCEKAKKNLRDNKVPGLMLSVGKRSKTFYLYRRLDGKPRRIKLGRFPGLSVEQARRKALSLLDGIENGTYGKPTTLGELWDVYCDVKRKKKSLDQDQYHYDRHLATWSGRKLDGITVADVQRLHNSLPRVTANRVRALLSTMFNLAVRQQLVQFNPVQAVPKNRETSRDRFLTAEELPVFFKALKKFDRDFRDFVLLCLYTGARRGNVERMRPSEIDGHIWRVDTKTGPQEIYLCDEALKIIKRGIPRPTNVRRKWDQMPFDDLRIHDLRRTLGSWQAATGASLPIIGKTLGHSSASTTQIYARLDLSAVKRSVDTAVKAMRRAK